MRVSAIFGGLNSIFDAQSCSEGKCAFGRLSCNAASLEAAYQQAECTLFRNVYMRPGDTAGLALPVRSELPAPLRVSPNISPMSETIFARIDRVEGPGFGR